MKIYILKLLIFLKFFLFILFNPAFSISFNEYKLSIIEEGLPRYIKKKLEENIGSLKVLMKRF